MTTEEVRGAARAAAENYRQQRQEADGRNSDFPEFEPGQVEAWAAANPDKLKRLVRKNGISDEAVGETLRHYLSEIDGVADLGKYDDPNIKLILRGLINRVEAICRAHGVPIRDGVAYGVTPKLKVEASQLAVMGTEASIVSVSQGLPVFCNMASKALSLTMPVIGDRISWDPREVRDQLERNPELVGLWQEILACYALGAWPYAIDIPALSDVQLWVRLRTLDAMELFAVAHEYGHHVMGHGSASSSADSRDPFKDEHEADYFARIIAMHDDLNRQGSPLYSASGSGAVLLLGLLDLVRKARSVIESGQPICPPRKSHPPVAERIGIIAMADSHVPDMAEIFNDMRCCATGLLEIVWQCVEPGFRRLHDEGVRPIADAKIADGWLPLDDL